MDRTRSKKIAALAATLAGVLAPALAAADSAGFPDDWLATSDAAKESQPHWISPMVTVTPRLEQEYRYDQSWQDRPRGVTLDNYGGGKGAEFIPTLNSEVIIGVPAYLVRDTPHGRNSGWGDETLLVKYRLLSQNEEHGNYIVTGFLGLSLPSGSEAFTSHKVIVTPTIAAGKGWGTRAVGFDIQSTLGIAIPTGNLRELGSPVSWNTALQGHWGKLWPEIEANYTYYRDGPNDGKSQTAITGGLVLGRFELGHRAKLILGGGYQKTVSSFKTFNHTWLVTGRVAF
ncbi:MAG: hypothetical protein JSR67_12810 [Proteobacteria bacterium]|nr:hypothetical protein [Pseudomonadota bacterium]